MELPTHFRAVVLDCDSTLSTIEGIEELAGARREEVATLTDVAMRGEIPLEQVYGRRLALVRPSRDAVAALGRRYVETLVPDARETVAALRGCGVAVRVISGGLLEPVIVLARALGIDPSHVAAVAVHFDERGDYAGFDERSPLARAGGKRDQLERWRDELPRPLMLVGDGATDLEARDAADAFVAFAGVVERAAVVAAADVVVRARSLAPILALALGDAEPRDLSARATWRRGRALLEADPDARPRTRPSERRSHHVARDV